MVSYLSVLYQKSVLKFVFYLLSILCSTFQMISFHFSMLCNEINVFNSTIAVEWHSRGRGFDSLQLHQRNQRVRK